MSTSSDIYSEVAAIEKEVKSVLRDADIATKARRGVELSQVLQGLLSEVPEDAMGLRTYIRQVRYKLMNDILGMGLEAPAHDLPATLLAQLERLESKGKLGYEESLQKVSKDHPAPPILADYPSAKKARVTRDEMAEQWAQDRKSMLSHLAANERIMRDLSLQVTKERQSRATDTDIANRWHDERLKEVRQQHGEQLHRVADERDDLRIKVQKLTNDLHRSRVQVEALTTALALEIPMEGTEGDA